MKFYILSLFVFMMASQTAHASFDPNQTCMDSLDKAYSAHFEEVIEMAKGNEADLMFDIEPIKEACGSDTYQATTKSINQLLFGKTKPFEKDELCIYDIYRAYSYQMYKALESQGADFKDLNKDELLEVLASSKYCDKKIKDFFLSKIIEH